jgi:hypothetical protein
MRPTVEEQLDGLLRNAARLVKHVRGAWASTLPFLVEDNTRLAVLLDRLSAVVPGMSAEIDALVEARPTEPEVDVAIVSARNADLRSVLARVIRELPRTSDGLAARNEIGSYLGWRVEADPT